ncbi:molybdenum cofactor cytidylyltransferase [Effusibacillus lacus]|nr:molybdenum cofactor cytidylyltransferase [Effusibacillus lacus]
MGTCKLLLPIGEETMLRHTVKKALLTRTDGVVVVVNAEIPELANQIGDLPVVILTNQTSNGGMSSSLRFGIEYLLENSAEAAVVLLADQPEIDPSVVNRTVVRYQQTGAPVVQAVYRGTPGHPVLFDRTVFRELQAITGDQGGREVVRKYLAARETVDETTAVPEDIDTFEDYQRVVERSKGTSRAKASGMPGRAIKGGYWI